MEKIKEITQLILNIFKIISITCPAIGIIIFTLYCMKIHFYPPDVQISETLIFILITISFGMIYILIVGLLYVSSIAIFFSIYMLILGFPSIIYYKVKAYKIKNYKLKGIPSFIIIIFIIAYGLISEVFILAFSIGSDIFSFKKIGIVQILMVIFFSFKFCADNNIFKKLKKARTQKIEKEKSDKNKKIKNIIFYIFLLILIPIGAGLFSTNLFEFPFNIYGFRQTDVSIFIDKNYFNLVQQKKINGLNSKNSKSNFKITCNDDFCELKHIDILLTNVGSKTLIFIPSIENKTKGLCVELPNSAIKLNLKDYSQSN
ncbi:MULTISPECIES: hypothetical protein [unclassified Snodgrassella]|uniref:hypothetical protein n=1 Tax=unclassified Snodgrassella TaxID=2625236 RepID=UPI0018DDB4C8|nr:MULTISPECIES: hypothetical protein [unclassified Snodgrassella]MBI0159300.1 hypothetical protein [Snodgrassella sp. W6238H11]MBI0161532.1 hypothetical protein [Snodgrassella sp. W6238H14]